MYMASGTQNFAVHNVARYNNMIFPFVEKYVSRLSFVNSTMSTLFVAKISLSN